MKKIFAVALVLAATCSLDRIASAQDGRMQATIPFNFDLGSSHLAAGTYVINTSNGTPFLYMRNKETGAGAAMLAPASERAERDTSKLVFHRYGSHYFLSEVRCATCSLNVHLVPSKAEKRARTQIEEANLFPNDPILIAMK